MRTSQLRPINHRSKGLEKHAFRIPDRLILSVASKPERCTLHDPTCKHHLTNIAPVTFYKRRRTKPCKKRSWILEHRTKVRLSIPITAVSFVLYYSSVSMGGDYTIVVSLLVYLFSLRDLVVPRLQVNLDALLRCSYSTSDIKAHLITSNCPYRRKNAREREGEWILVCRG